MASPARHGCHGVRERSKERETRGEARGEALAWGGEVAPIVRACSVRGGTDGRNGSSRRLLVLSIGRSSPILGRSRLAVRFEPGRVTDGLRPAPWRRWRWEAVAAVGWSGADPEGN